MAAASSSREIFAANRAVGRIALTVGAEGGGTRRVARATKTVRCACAFPIAGDALEAVIVNTAGGMTGGDRFDYRHRRSARARG